MNEMYWITRLDSINVFLFIITILSLFFSIVSFYMSILLIEKEDILKAKKYTIFGSIIFIVFSIALVFIPTKQDVYEIIGIGATYEYLKNNQDIKKIPDNTIRALEIWSENILSEQELNQTNNNQSKK